MGRTWVVVTAVGSLLGAALPAAAGAEPAPEPRFRAMVERPLFSPTRRPAARPPAARLPEAPAAPPPPPAPDVSLSGVIAGGGGGLALLKRPGDAAPTRVALGGLVDGWTLAELRPRSVVLRRDGRSVTVDMAAPR